MDCHYIIILSIKRLEAMCMSISGGLYQDRVRGKYQEV